MSLVYLVEDDAALRALVIEALQDEGHTVVALKTVEQLRNQPFESRGVAVVDAWGTDLRELGDAGRQSIRRVSAAMPTIMLSGRGWVDSTCAEDLGLVALLRKPTDLETLLLLVDETAAAFQSAPDDLPLDGEPLRTRRQ